MARRGATRRRGGGAPPARGTLAVVAAAVVLAACGGDDGGRSGPGDGGEVVAPDVEVQLALSGTGDGLAADVVVVNERDEAVLITDPADAHGDPDVDPRDAPRLVAPRAVVEQRSGDDADALPVSSGLVVGPGRTFAASIDLGAGDWRTVELCVEVAPLGEATGSGDHGDAVRIVGRGAGEPATLACSGPIEVPA